MREYAKEVKSEEKQSPSNHNRSIEEINTSFNIYLNTVRFRVKSALGLLDTMMILEEGAHFMSIEFVEICIFCRNITLTHSNLNSQR